MKNMKKNIISFVGKYKKVSIFLCVVFLAGVSYLGYQKFFKASSGTSSTATITLKKRSFVSTVSGVGQVASGQVDVRSKISGDVVYVAATNGQMVKKWDLLAMVDTSDADKSVRDAEINLENAKINYEKFVEPADDLTILQAQNSLSQAEQSKEKAEATLTKAYEDGFSTVSSAFLDLSDILKGVSDILFSSDFNDSQWNADYYASVVAGYDTGVYDLKDLTLQNYQSAKSAYDDCFSKYKTVTRTSSQADIENIISETYDATKKISDAVKSANNLIRFYQDELVKNSLTPDSILTQQISSLDSYISNVNSHLSSLLGAKNTLNTSKEDILNNESSVTEKEQNLKNLTDGPDDLDLRAQQLSLQQKENALADAKDKLADYYIRAPFDGILTSFDLKKGDNLSSGVVASVVSSDRYIELSLNEVDVAKVKVGQKAQITFDAIDGLVVDGEVSDIDAIGTVNQGVVEYGAKISFDNTDGRIKPGMSASVDIVTEQKDAVLLVPNSAITERGNNSFVKVMKDGQASDVKVEVGSSNEVSTEITSGLNEGDLVLIQATGGFGGSQSSGGYAAGATRNQATSASSGNANMMRMMRGLDR